MVIIEALIVGKWDHVGDLKSSFSTQATSIGCKALAVEAPSYMGFNNQNRVLGPTILQL